MGAGGEWLKGELPAGGGAKAPNVVATAVTFIEGRSEQELQRRVFQLDAREISEVVRGQTVSRREENPFAALRLCARKCL